MITRAKFKCIECRLVNPLQSDPQYEVALSVVGEDSPENKEFFRFTPGGTIRFFALRRDCFELNKEYYVDFHAAIAKATEV